MALLLHRVGNEFRVWATERDTYLPGTMTEAEAREWNLARRIRDAVRDHLQRWEWGPSCESMTKWEKELQPEWRKELEAQVGKAEELDEYEMDLWKAAIGVDINAIEGGLHIALDVKPYPTYGVERKRRR